MPLFEKGGYLEPMILSFFAAFGMASLPLVSLSHVETSNYLFS